MLGNYANQILSTKECVKLHLSTKISGLAIRFIEGDDTTIGNDEQRYILAQLCIGSCDDEFKCSETVELLLPRMATAFKLLYLVTD